MFSGRDRGIESIKARKDRRCYGMGLGIIILDDVYPGFPGDVRNASAYPFPIQFEVAEGIDIKALVIEEDKSPCLEPIQRAAKKLERMGCRAIAAECGYFAYFQKEIAGHVDVPVFMSSLLQVPWAQQLVGPDKLVGILVAEKAYISDAHLTAVDIEIGGNYVIAGAEDEYQCPARIHRVPSMPKPHPISSPRVSISSGAIPRWAPWYLSARDSLLLPGRFSARSIFHCSVGERFWILPIALPFTAIITGMCDFRPDRGVSPRIFSAQTE